MVKRDELLTLREHYAEEVDRQLNFCLGYLNFYAGLLSALLAGVLTGLLSLKPPTLLLLVLLIGPALICLLAYTGYRTVLVFYRRFIEAWITSRNLEEMLGLRQSPEYEPGTKAPLVKSAHGGGFIAEFERPPVRELLDTAARDAWSAERLVRSVVSTGDTLKYARRVLASFAAASLLLAVCILVVVAREVWFGGSCVSVA